MQYYVNKKYFNNTVKQDTWAEISEAVYNKIVSDLHTHALEKGFDIKSYMDFVKTCIVKTSE